MIKLRPLWLPLTFCLLLSLLMTGCSSPVLPRLISRARSQPPGGLPANSTPFPVSTPATVSYAAHPDSDPDLTSLDMYAPNPANNLPVMIYVHGGGWKTGDKANLAQKPAAFNHHNFLFISTNYRLYPAVDVPSQAHDIAQAIAWTVANIASYGGDPQRIFLMGHSAGAHLVTLVATDASYLEQVGLSPHNLSGVVSLDTRGYNIPELMELKDSEGTVYQEVFGADPDFWEAMSPITYAIQGNFIPPFFIAYSKGPYRFEAASSFANQLRQAGVLVELGPATDQTHAEINQEFGLPGDTVTQAVFDFLAGLP